MSVATSLCGKLFATHCSHLASFQKKKKYLVGKGGDAGEDKLIKLDLFKNVLLQINCQKKLALVLLVKEQMVNLPRRKTTWIWVLSENTRS